MREKQGKLALVLDPSEDEIEEEVFSPDPFEACIPKRAPSQVINNNAVKEKESRGLEIGVGAVLGVTNAVPDF